MRPFKPRTPGSAHDALSRMMTEIGEQATPPGDGMKIAAAFEDRSIFTLYKALDPDGPSEISYARVARLVDHFKVEAPAHHMAGLAGGIFVPMAPAAGRNERWAELGADTAEEVGALTAQCIRALGDGPSRETAKESLPVLYDIIRHVSGMISVAQAVANPGENDGTR